MHAENMFLVGFIAFLGGISMPAEAAKKPLIVCTHLKTLDLDPYKPIGDGTRHSVLDVAVRDYLSQEEDFPGLLEATNFSADGTTFTGRVAADAKWQDGTPLSALEAALGIAKGLTFRPAFPLIRVVGTEKINEPGWETRSYSGIKIVDNKTFELVFDTSSKVANRVGVIHELLSSGELSNRLWPTRLSKSSAAFDVVSYYPMKIVDGLPSFTIDGHTVQYRFKDDCKDGDITSPLTIGSYLNIEDYDIALGKREMVLEAYLNPNRPGLGRPEVRSNLAAWLRNAVQYPGFEKGGITIPSGHFTSDESGHRSGFTWPTTGNLQELAATRKELTLQLANKTFETDPTLVQVKAKLQSLGIAVKWAYREEDIKNVDILLQPASNQGKRQVWIEKITGTPLNLAFLKLHPKTHAATKAIQERSASTIPVDVELLKQFEANTFEETSIVPLFRYVTLTMSKKTSPIELVQSVGGRRRLRKKKGANQ